MGLKQTSAPATDPITLTEAKLHLKVENTSDDALITVLMGAATAQAQAFQHRQYVTATWVYTRDDFPADDGDIWLPRPPLIAVSSVSYLNTSGVATAYTTFTSDVASVRGRIYPSYSYTWPSVRDIANAVTITYTAGYGAAAAVPDEIKAAIKLFLGTLYEHREHWGEVKLNENPAALALLWPDRVAEEW